MQNPKQETAAKAERYGQLALLFLAAGVLFPLLYLRQHYENSILVACQLSRAELSGLLALLGVVFTCSYLPSGWLADRFCPRKLIVLALTLVGGLGLYFAQFPALVGLRVIFVGWGLGAGLIFWGALIKEIKLRAAMHEQGRVFGLLDGSRGLIEAFLASLALAIFAALSARGYSPQQALRPVIYLYACTCLAVAGLCAAFLRARSLPPASKTFGLAGAEPSASLGADLRFLITMPELWVVALLLACGYQLFWATYSFSAYLQGDLGLSATFVALITAARMWTRPLAGWAVGYWGDRSSREGVMALCYALTSAGLLLFAWVPGLQNGYAALLMVLVLGLLTYAIRGLYWALLQRCDIPERVTGLAIGLVSFLGYSPDIYLPLLQQALMRHFTAGLGLKVYFTLLSLAGLAGAGCLAFLAKKQRLKKPPRATVSAARVEANAG